MPTQPPQPPGAFLTEALTALGEQQPVLTQKAIVNTQGAKVLDKGVALHQGLYERLRQHHLAEPLEDNVSPAHAVTGHSLHTAAADLIASSALLQRLYNDTAFKAVVLDLLDKTPLPPAIALQLTVARDLYPSLFRHLLQTALVNAWLVQAPLVPRYDLGSALVAGLMHDLGMLHLNPLLLKADGALSPELERQLASHPVVSHTLLERHHVYPNEVLKAVLEHQECADGSGYPRRLAAADTSPLGQSLALAQAVSAMFNPARPNPALRLSVLLRMNPHRFGATLTAKVLGAVQPLLQASTETDNTSRGDTTEGFVPALTGVHQALLTCPNTHTDTPWARHLLQQLEHMRRCLAEAGVAPEQLGQLDHSSDPALVQELRWLAREAVWQLRALARQAQLAWTPQAPGAQDHQRWFETVHDLGQQWLTPENTID